MKFLTDMKTGTHVALVLCTLSLLMVVNTAIGMSAAPAMAGWMGGLTALGLLVAAVGAISMTQRVSAPLKEAILIAETVASGDLSQEFSSERGGDFGRLLNSLGDMEDTLTALVTRIKSSTDQITAAAGHIDSGNTDLSRRTEDQAVALKQTAGSMDALTSTVRHNADRAQEANRFAVSASGVAEQGGAAVRNVVEQMGAISSSSKKMADIIEVIEGIAFQTNILALNAAVEAARAGEQGRGFAVVASEVQNLAARSGNAAKEIKQLIHSSVEHVEAGSASVQQAGTTMEEVVRSVRQVSAILADISSALAHQSSDIEQVNQTIAQMEQITHQNASLVQQAAGSASALSGQARELQHAVDEFRL